MADIITRGSGVIAPCGASRLRLVSTAALLVCTLVLSACEGDTAGNQDNAPVGNQAAKSTAALTPVTGETAIYIDFVNNQAPSPEKPVVVKAQETPQFMVSGWAVDKPAQSAAGGVIMVIDGNVEVPTKYGDARPDVAKFLDNPNYTKSNFVGWVNASTITKGQHILSFKVLTADKRGYYYLPNKITLAIE